MINEMCFGSCGEETRPKETMICHGVYGMMDLWIWRAWRVNWKRSPGGKLCKEHIKAMETKSQMA